MKAAPPLSITLLLAKSVHSMQLIFGPIFTATTVKYTLEMLASITVNREQVADICCTESR